MPTVAPEEKTNGMAIAAFVLGLLSLVPFAVILGIVALVEIRKLRQRGQGLAIAGLVLSAVWLLVAGALVVVIGSSPNAVSGPTVGPEPLRTRPTLTRPSLTRPSLPPGYHPPVQTPLSALKVGDCLAPPNPTTPSTIEVEMCSSLHQAQVFAMVKVPLGGQAGQDSAEAEGRSACQTEMYTVYHDPMQLPSQEAVLYYLAPEAVGSTFREATCAIVFPEWGQEPLPSPRPASAYTAVQLRFLALEEAARVPARVFSDLRGLPPWRTDQIYSLRAAAADRAEAAWLQSMAVGPAADADARTLAGDDVMEAKWWDLFNSAHDSAGFVMHTGEADPAQQLNADISQLRADLGLPTRPSVSHP